MSSSRTTAVVLGAGTSGMLAARVLSDAFTHVVMIAFLRVMHMMRSPFSLMAPGALAHVLARTARRALGPPPPPAVKAQLLEADQ